MIGALVMGKARNDRRLLQRQQAKIIKAATKYDVKGCDVCGHQPRGFEVYGIGRVGGRVVGVCQKHIKSLDVGLAIQFYQEREESQKQREMTEAVSTDGPKH
jgi:hypothetical protein